MNNIYEMQELSLLRRGKVREVYDLGNSLLFVASDRISAFDVIMNELVIGKGKILNGISEFWFNNTKHIIANHLITTNVDEYPAECQKYADYLAGRSMIVRKCTPLAVECVVRGYVAGSGWKEYKNSQTICGIKLPAGLQEFEKLPEPIFTPSTKEDVGHDENIDFARCVSILGEKAAETLKNKSIELYSFGEQYMRERGIILADTKFEFGVCDGEIILIDEAMTPDSSRFWLKDDYAPGKEQTNFDKQILRDYLETCGWNKMPPPPVLPESIITGTMDKYKVAYKLITGEEFVG